MPRVCFVSLSSQHVLFSLLQPIYVSSNRFGMLFMRVKDQRVSHSSFYGVRGVWNVAI